MLPSLLNSWYEFALHTWKGGLGQQAEVISPYNSSVVQAMKITIKIYHFLKPHMSPDYNSTN